MDKSIPREKNSKLLMEIFKHINLAVLLCNESGQIVLVNNEVENITGLTRDELTKMNIREFSILDSTVVKNIFKTAGDYWKFEVLIQHKNGEFIPRNLDVNMILEEDTKEKLYIFQFRDIHPMAFKDPLTNLPNRRCFHHCLEKGLVQASNDNQVFSVLYIDLDRFKLINDTLGHSYGDILLKQVADRLQSCLSDEDVLARIGGDEFLCLLKGTGKRNDAEKVAKTILEALAAPFFLHEEDYYITASIGISLYPYDGDDVETLVSSADSAMYRAKKKGRNQFEWAKAEVHAGSYEQLALENNLRKALQREELLLYYQPQVDLNSNQIVGLEALLRWEHPEFGIISPADFIPIAEESGLILPIGEWVIRTACLQNKKWQQEGYKPVRVAINLSARHFLQRNLPAKIAAILEETGLSADLLELEITETVLMQDYQMASDILKQLKDMGIHLSIDDFGTGYSSLSYLTELPVDALKIDRSFIKDMENNSSSKAVTYAIISLAHHLNLKVVAEGVETEAQLSYMKEKQCDMMQGFLFSKPIPPHELTRLLHNESN
ncbi:MAG TPA: EAL domain-containing protein [Bacillota bacterium]|nr:EAL domain-containing protein [Bacillota bacterium]